MAVIKKYNLSGDEIGQVALDDAVLEKMANSQMIKDYLVAYRANQRQWSANTKGRSEVSHSKQKPHPQKGTGRARQGSLAAPQYKGGGRVFGPKPKFDQHVKINRKEKRAVIKSLLSQKIQGQRLHILSLEGLDAPKTKVLADFLKKRELTQKRVLFLGEDIYMTLGSDFEDSIFEAVHTLDAVTEDKASTEPVSDTISKEYDLLVQSYAKRDAVIRSIRNIPKITFSLLPNVNGYEVVLNQDIVLLEGAVEQLMTILVGEK